MNANEKSASLARKNWPFYILIAAICFAAPFLLYSYEAGTFSAWLLLVWPLSILAGIVFTLVRKRFDWWFALVIFGGWWLGNLLWEFIELDKLNLATNLWTGCIASLCYIAVGCGLQSILTWRANTRPNT